MARVVIRTICPPDDDQCPRFRDAPADDDHGSAEALPCQNLCNRSELVFSVPVTLLSDTR
jgi:hypothetical protein